MKLADISTCNAMPFYTLPAAKQTRLSTGSQYPDEDMVNGSVSPSQFE